jgi:group I intron endonuclease
MKICGIYKVTSPTNCIYIGQSINILRRWNEYSRLKGCAKNSRLLNSLSKYGFENHKFEILHQCKIEELNNYEIYYIELFNSFDTDHGLNLHSGGRNHIISKETRKKQSESHLGQPAWNKGIKRTEEQKKAHSEKMKGKKASDETKKKMSEARKGKKHSEETRKKLSEQKIGNKVWLGKKHTEESKSKMRKPKTKKIC